jgi:hypothetical protein
MHESSLGDAPICARCLWGGKRMTRRCCLPTWLAAAFTAGALGCIVPAVGLSGPWTIVQHFPNATAIPASLLNTSAANPYEQNEYLLGGPRLAAFCVEVPTGRAPRVSRSGGSSGPTTTTVCQELPPHPVVFDISTAPGVHAADGNAHALALGAAGVALGFVGVAAGCGTLASVWGCCARLVVAGRPHPTRYLAATAAALFASAALLFAALSSYNSLVFDPFQRAVVAATDDAAWAAAVAGDSGGAVAQQDVRDALQLLLLRRGGGYAAVAAGGALCVLSLLLFAASAAWGCRWAFCAPRARGAPGADAPKA